MYKLLNNKVLAFLLVCGAFLFPQHASAGWSFTATLKTAGDCGTSYQYTINIPAALPTEAMCQSLRSNIEQINVSGGSCSVYYVCTPCTGFDDPTSGVPVISSDGIAQGNPYFSQHPSYNIENWIRDNKQYLLSMGVNEADLNNLLATLTPLTNNPAFDQAYSDKSVDFVPKTKNQLEKSSGDANVVDLTGLGDKPGTVDPNDLKMPKSTTQTTAQLPTDNVKTSALASSVPALAPTETTTTEIKREMNPMVAISRDALKEGVDLYVKNPYIGFASKALINLYAENANALVAIYNNQPCPSTGEILKNTFSVTASDLVDAAPGIVADKVVSAGKAYAVHSGMKVLDVQSVTKYYTNTKDYVEKTDKAITWLGNGYKVGTELQAK